MPSAITAESFLPIVAKLMAELHPEAVAHRDITLDSSLNRDLGLDSLTRMELLSRLEKEFAVKLPERVLVTAETPRDLLRCLNQEEPPAMDLPLQPVGQPDLGGERRVVALTNAHTLQDVLAEHLLLHPDAPHITLLQDDGEKSISYKILHQEGLKVASRLRRFDLEPGEPVVIMLPTCADYFYTFFGTLLAGGIPVPLYPPARPSQIEEHVRRHRRIIANAGARLLVTVAEARPVARLLMSQVPELRKVITTDTFFAEAPAMSALSRQASDIAFLQYTSGSTGDPKGVVLTHANLLANIRAMGRVCRVTTGDVFVSWLPLYHDMGLIGAWFGSLCHGCRLVVMSPLAFLARPERWLRAIARYGGTLSASPNFGFEICASRLGDELLAGLDLSSWRLAFNGAEPVIPATLRKFQARFEPYGLRAEALAPVYGLAESSVGLLFPQPGSGVRIDRIVRNIFAGSGQAVIAQERDETALEFVCCGRPLPNHQVRVVDAQGRELPERQEGRLQFMGPSATSGYFRNAEETRKLFRGEWLDTGDLAYIAAGEVYLTSRIKDIIIRAGRNIHPHELEEVIGNIPGIRKGCTAVFASHSAAAATERLVVLTESRMTSAGDRQQLRQRIVEATVDLLEMAPDEVVIGRPGTVLKTSSGKIRRSACRQLYESGHIGRKRPAVWLQLLRMGLSSIRPLGRRFAGRVAELLYAGYCWLLLAIGAAVVWCGLMVLPGGERCWRLAGRTVRLLCRLTGIRLQDIGAANIPLGRSYLVVSNHMSYLDSLVLTAMLPEPCHFVAKAELGRNALLRTPLAKLGVFLVDRFDAGQGLADMGKIEEGVDKGLRPLFFAEGTLQRMPGLLPFQMGAFVLACRKQLAVTPLVIQGTRNILRSGSWFPRRGNIEVTILPSCLPTGTDWQGAIDLRDRVRREILRHLGEPDLAGEYTSLRQMGLKPTER